MSIVLCFMCRRCALEPLQQIWQLTPAVQQIDDVQNFAAALLSIVICSPQGMTAVNALLQLPIAQKLQPYHCFELINLWFMRPTGTTCSAWELPGVQQLDVMTLMSLINLALQRHEFHVLPKLVLVPVAAQLSPTLAWAALTHLAAKPFFCIEAFCALLPLPAAQHMPEGHCRALLQTVLQYCQAVYLDLLLERVPGVLQVFQQGLPPAALTEVMCAAAYRGKQSLVLKCLDHASSAALPSQTVYRLVHAAASTVWTPTVAARLQRLPGAQLLQLGESISLLDVACCNTTTVNDPVLQLWLAFEPMQRLPAPGVLQVLDQLLAGPTCSATTGWQKLLQVLQLPGAQQVAAENILFLVAATVMHPGRPVGPVCSPVIQSTGDELAKAKEAFLLVLLQSPGARALTADGVAAVAGNCFAKGWQAAFECALKLPGAAALSLQQVKLG